VSLAHVDCDDRTPDFTVDELDRKHPVRGVFFVVSVRDKMRVKFGNEEGSSGCDRLAAGRV